MPQIRFVVVLQYPPVYATDPRRCWLEKMNRNEYEFNTQASTSRSRVVWVWVGSLEIAPKPQCTNTFANQWGFICRLHRHRYRLRCALLDPDEELKCRRSLLWNSTNEYSKYCIRWFNCTNVSYRVDKLILSNWLRVKIPVLDRWKGICTRSVLNLHYNIF